MKMFLLSYWSLSFYTHVYTFVHAYMQNNSINHMSLSFSSNLSFPRILIPITCAIPEFF